MSYILKQTGTSYAIAIGHYGKVYNAGNDITLAMEVLGKLNETFFTPNLDQRLDGLYICWGNHQYTKRCDYVKVISYLPASGTQPSDATIVTTTDKTVPYMKPIETTAVPPLPWSSIPATAVPEPGAYNWTPDPWNPSPSTPFNPIPLTVPQPVTGWMCPRCGNGVSPYTSICPCNHKVTITC